MANKYKYFRVIQQNYGQGWEDISEYEQTSTHKLLEFTDKLDKFNRPISLFSHDFKEYKLLKYPTRYINRKELKNV